MSEVTGFPGDDGRPRQDTAPAGARRHPRPARPRRTISRRPRHTASRLIDLVVVNLYPFVKAAANPDTPFDALIEEIDIGGPSLVRAAAKNFQDVLVVVSPARLRAVLAGARSDGGAVARSSASTSRARRSRTPAATTRAIAATLGDGHGWSAGVQPRRAGLLPASLSLDLRKVRDLRYGENPHQRAALYERRGAGQGFAVLQGKELSYTNLLDLDAAARIVARVRRARRGGHQAHEPVRRCHGHAAPPTPTCARAMPTRSRPSAASSGSTARSMRTTARAIVSTFIEAVDRAGGGRRGPRRFSRRKPNMRVVVPAAPAAGGGMVAVEDDRNALDRRRRAGADARSSSARPRAVAGRGLKVVSKRQPTPSPSGRRFALRGASAPT